VRALLTYSLLFSLAALPLAAQSATFDFSQPVVLSGSQAPGTWYTDRFAPHGFVSQQPAPDGAQNTLKESIAASDLQPGPGNFYDTQGRKFDMPPNTLSVTIALYVPSAWKTENARKAGFWLTAFDSTNSVSSYPIIEFQGDITSAPLNGPTAQINGGVPGFYGWQVTTGGYTFIGLPAGFTYDSWVQLTITLVPGTGFVYTVGDLANGGVSLTVPGNSDVYVGNTILQGYNYGANYDIFWDGSLAAGAIKTHYFSNLNLGDSVINLTNDGASGGNICAFVYTFDPNEEMISCCACPLTPNGLSSLSVQSDLISNTLTSSVPTSLTVTLVSVAANPGQFCDAGFGGGTATVSALQAWGTTLHPGPVAGSFAINETPFTSVSSLVGIPGLTNLMTNCGFLRRLGSGFGICSSCRAGGLGAERQ